MAPYFNTCTLQPIPDWAHFAWLVPLSFALCLLSRLRVRWGQGFVVMFVKGPPQESCYFGGHKQDDIQRTRGLHKAVHKKGGL